MKHMQKHLVLAIALVLAASALAACTSVTPAAERTILYGVWPQIGGNLQTLYRIDDDGQNKTALAENSPELYLMQSITFHNYYTPQSHDARFAAFYSKNDAGMWGLNIYSLGSGATALFYTKELEPALVRFREGFSPNDRYYAYTYRDAETGALLISVVDLSNGTALEAIPNAYLVDFTGDGDGLIYLGVGEGGTVSGIFKISLPGKAVTSIYVPGAGEEVSYLTLSPDGKWLVFSDAAQMILYRIPSGGGTKQEIYTFTGTSLSVNYDPDGNYLVVLDLSQDAQIVKLFNSSFTEVMSLDTIGSGYMSFSSNGEKFAYQMPVNPLMVLYVTSPGTNYVTTIDSSALLYQPQFTADGSQIVYIRFVERSAKYGELILAGADGSNPVTIDQTVTSFSLRSDGSIIYIHYDPENFLSTLMKVDATGANPVILDGPFAGTAAIIK